MRREAMRCCLGVVMLAFGGGVAEGSPWCPGDGAVPSASAGHDRSLQASTASCGDGLRIRMPAGDLFSAGAVGAGPLDRRIGGLDPAPRHPRLDAVVLRIGEASIATRFTFNDTEAPVDVVHIGDVAAARRAAGAPATAAEPAGDDVGAALGLSLRWGDAAFYGAIDVDSETIEDRIDDVAAPSRVGFVVGGGSAGSAVTSGVYVDWSERDDDTVDVGWSLAGTFAGQQLDTSMEYSLAETPGDPGTWRWTFGAQIDILRLVNRDRFDGGWFAFGRAESDIETTGKDRTIGYGVLFVGGIVF